MPLIVLFNRHIFHILYICATNFTAPTKAQSEISSLRLCYFPESKRKGTFNRLRSIKSAFAPCLGQAVRLTAFRPTDGEWLFTALLLPHASVCVDSDGIFYTASLSKIPSQPTHIVALYSFGSNRFRIIFLSCSRLFSTVSVCTVGNKWAYQ